MTTPTPTTSFTSNVSLNTFSTTSGGITTAHAPTLTLQLASGATGTTLQSTTANNLIIGGTTVSITDSTNNITQTLTNTLTAKTGEATVPSGIQFSNDAGFIISDPSDNTKTVNVRISDLYSGEGMTELANVVAALCRANYNQVSNQSLNDTTQTEYDLKWIQAYAATHKPYEPSP